MRGRLTGAGTRSLRAILASVCLAAWLAGTSTPAQQTSSLIEVVAGGFKDPVGVAVDRDGSIVVSDRKAGTITRIALHGRRDVLVRGLEGPAGVTFDQGGGLLIVEERGRRVLRRDPSGTLAILASGIVGPRWIAAAPNGTVYLSAKRLVRVGKRRTKDDDRGKRMRILQLPPSGRLRTVADGFHGLEGLAWADGMLYAAVTKMPTDRGRNRTWIMRVPIRADGVAGTPESVLRGRKNVPMGVAIDRFGALFVATRSGGGNRAGGRNNGGALLKRLATGRVASILTRLRKPQGVAFEAAGHLLVVDGGNRGRLLRIHAPAPPAVSVPAFSNQSPLTITGQAAPGHLIDAFHPDDFRQPLVSAQADVTTGTFTLPVPLDANTETRFSFTATAARGLGLSSAPESRTIVHDDQLPRVTILEPVTGTHVRDAVTLRARGEDDGSGVASIAFMLDDAVVARVDNPGPPEPVVGTTRLETHPVAEGPHTLTVVAVDRAGNAAAAAQLLVVDRTPPETQIVSGPSGETTETTATFVVTGTDAYSPTLDFAWRLDKGAWSPFGPATTVVVSALPPGAHTFEVKARDQAGNENDLSPAMQTFTVIALRIQITEPADGAIVTTPSVWLRGTVEGSSDVTVTVPLPPGLVIPSLPASTEAGTFAVEVPIDATTTTLTAVAVDGTTGATAADTISVVVRPDPTASLSRFTALPAAGLAPHVVTFSINLGEGTRVALDLDSDGTVDFDGPTLEGLPFVYDRPGIYVPTLRATTTDGQILTYRTVVEVYDRAALDARLQALWNGFTEALQSGDVARAVGFIHGNRRAAWQEYFGQLLPDELAAEVGGFTAIELMRVARGGAEYEMLREEDGRVFSYPIALVADVDGRWRLWQF